MYNKVILVGNLTKDIELRYSQSGMAIAKTSIATSRKFTQNGEKKEEVCFVDITSFGRGGEILNQYCRKGSKVLIEGRLNFEQWVDQNGGKRSKHSVTVETMQMLDSRNTPSNPTPPADYYSDSPAPQKTPPTSYENIPAGANDHPQYPSSPQAKQTAKDRAEHNKTAHLPAMGQDIPEIDIDEDEIPF